MLSDLTIKATKSKGKQYRLTDEKGLYLFVKARKKNEALERARNEQSEIHTIGRRA